MFQEFPNFDRLQFWHQDRYEAETLWTCKVPLTLLAKINSTQKAAANLFLRIFKELAFFFQENSQKPVKTVPQVQPANWLPPHTFNTQFYSLSYSGIPLFSLRSPKCDPN